MHVGRFPCLVSVISCYIHSVDVGVSLKHSSWANSICCDCRRFQKNGQVPVAICLKDPSNDPECWLCVGAAKRPVSLLSASFFPTHDCLNVMKMFFAFDQLCSLTNLF